MSVNLLKLAHNLNVIAQSACTCSLDGICAELSEFLGCDVLLVDKTGKILVSKAVTGFLTNTVTNGFKNDGFIESRLNDRLNNIAEIWTYINVGDFNCLVLPISVSGEKSAALVMHKKNNFNDEEIAGVAFCCVAASIIMRGAKSEAEAEETRRSDMAKSAVDILSFSELEAVLHIFNELKSSEGFLVASRIAEKHGITRSVIVNAVRKLESAGVIESRSLGMKGTYIKVLNEKLMIELNKLRK